MVRTFRVHRSDYTNVVNHASEFREDLAHFDAALAEFAEFERRFEQRARPPFGLEVRRAHRLAVILRKRGLRIESINLRRATVQEKENDALSFRLEMRRLNGER